MLVDNTPSNQDFESTTTSEVFFRFEAEEYGGIAGRGFDNGKRWESKSVRQYTVPLSEIFQRYQVPKEIDYFSLDVEGT
jgi:hypothetical protein